MKIENVLFFCINKNELNVHKVYRDKLIEEGYGVHPKSLKKLQNLQDKLFARNNWAQNFPSAISK